MPSSLAASVLGVLLLTIAAPASGFAQTLGGVGERAQGMAGAFVAVADDSSAVYWTPAGLAWPTGSTFDAQFGAGARGHFVGFALPSLGLSYYRLPTVWVPEIRQKDGSGKVEIRPSTTSNIGATINQTIVNGLVIGTTARLVRAAYAGGPGRTTVDFDLGTIYAAGA